MSREWEDKVDLGLRGQRVLVTGASKGIGLGTAVAFAREGCHLRLAARSADGLEEARRTILAEYDVEVSIHPLDLSISDNLEELAEASGDIDILINNAGDIPAGSLDTVDEGAWRRGWDLKVYGYINLTRLIYRRMKAQGHGVIVNDIGNAGERLDFDYIAGSAGNASLMAFTRALGGRSLDDGIRVVGVNPGMVQTGRMTKLLKARARKLFNDEDRYEELLDRYPMSRGATVEEVADLMVFLASPRSSYTSGCVVTLDGGVSTRHSIV